MVALDVLSKGITSESMPSKLALGLGSALLSSMLELANGEPPSSSRRVRAGEGGTKDVVTVSTLSSSSGGRGGKAGGSEWGEWAPSGVVDVVTLGVSSGGGGGG